mmetsp:Transcript_103354/g.287756  ORF Transcript_103354/g.287756 Transcript_103354/m.287756 type:complete len:336 (+) Transcript_103354:451-1458(+)
MMPNGSVTTLKSSGVPENHAAMIRAPSSKQILMRPRLLPMKSASCPGLDLKMPAMPSGTTPTMPPRRGTEGPKSAPSLPVSRTGSCNALFSEGRSAGMTHSSAPRYRSPGTKRTTAAPAVYCSTPQIQRLKRTQRTAPKLMTPWGHARGTHGARTGCASTSGVAHWRASGKLRSISIVMVKYLARVTAKLFLRYHGTYDGIGWKARNMTNTNHHLMELDPAVRRHTVTNGIAKGMPKIIKKNSTQRVSSANVSVQGLRGSVRRVGATVTRWIAFHCASWPSAKKLLGSLHNSMAFSSCTPSHATAMSACLPACLPACEISTVGARATASQDAPRS